MEKIVYKIICFLFWTYRKLFLFLGKNEKRSGDLSVGFILFQLMLLMLIVDEIIVNFKIRQINYAATSTSFLFFLIMFGIFYLFLNKITKRFSEFEKSFLNIDSNKIKLINTLLFIVFIVLIILVMHLLAIR